MTICTKCRGITSGKDVTWPSRMKWQHDPVTRRMVRRHRLNCLGIPRVSRYAPGSWVVEYPGIVVDCHSFEVALEKALMGPPA